MSCCKWGLGQQAGIVSGAWRGREGIIRRFHHSPNPAVYEPHRPEHSCIAWVEWGEMVGEANWVGVEHLVLVKEEPCRSTEGQT